MHIIETKWATSLLGSKYYCSECGKELKKGDSVIIINDFVVYEAECYRKNREQAFKSFEDLRNYNLDNSEIDVDKFQRLVNSESIEDSALFYQLWAKQFLVLEIQKLVIDDAERYNTIGFLAKKKLNKKIKAINTLIKILGETYRNDYGMIKTEIFVKQKFPSVQSVQEPSIKQLKEREAIALLSIRRDVEEICRGIRSLIKEMKKLSSNIVIEERKEMKRQIEKSTKEAKRLA